ncbi:MAG TPA: DOMON-like domain-containing protein [Candidatus Binatia bacterium]|jgi:hypothetical protein|nr:DOMON-like domain-containing protein [Candidatus Binatia bacterium]
MSSAIAFPRSLTQHPESASRAVNGIEVDAGSKRAAEVTLGYVIRGDMARLLIPLPRPPRRIEGLWQHTCFEAFIGVKDSPAYFEFNFSPSSEWAAYAFRTYRDGGTVDDDKLDPTIVVRKESEMLELSAVIRLNRLPAMQPGATLRLGLCAVIEESDGRLSYWALNHPAGKPDFHHPDSFALDITLPG